MCLNILPEDILSHIWESPGRQEALVIAWATRAENSTSVVSKTVWAVVMGSPATVIFGAQTSGASEEPRRTVGSVVNFGFFDRRTRPSPCSDSISSSMRGSTACSEAAAELISAWMVGGAGGWASYMILLERLGGTSGATVSFPFPPWNLRLPSFSYLGFQIRPQGEPSRTLHQRERTQEDRRSGRQWRAGPRIELRVLRAFPGLWESWGPPRSSRPKENSRAV
jgi:hypothetical protein